jgi:hypothetical protein
MSETHTLPPGIEPGGPLLPILPEPEPISAVHIPGIQEGSIVIRETVPISSPDPGTVRRMEMPDLSQLQDWLAYRLHERHPEAAAAEIKGFLRNCITSNEWWFVRTELACGLAQLIRLPLESQPIVQDFFVFAMTPAEDDGSAADQAASIYPAMASWAAHQNASRLVIPRYSDVTQDTVRSRMQQTPRATGGRFLELGRVY